MNRRKFIRNSLTVTTVSILGLGGYTCYSVFHKPDFGYLTRNKQLIADMCETIIPRTDTPGAKDAQVEDFVIHCVRNILSTKEANTFIDGLEETDNYCKNNFKKGYVNCSVKEKTEALNAAKPEKIYTRYPLMNKVRIKLVGRDFITLLKDMTAIGYCTSEAGATKGLAYDHIPVKFIGCMPLAKGQKSWATK